MGCCINSRENEFHNINILFESLHLKNDDEYLIAYNNFKNVFEDWLLKIEHKKKKTGSITQTKDNIDHHVKYQIELQVSTTLLEKSLDKLRELTKLKPIISTDQKKLEIYQDLSALIENIKKEEDLKIN